MCDTSFHQPTPQSPPRRLRHRLRHRLLNMVSRVGTTFLTAHSNRHRLHLTVKNDEEKCCRKTTSVGIDDRPGNARLPAHHTTMETEFVGPGKQT